MSILEKRNGLLGFEFDRYVREHPKFVDKIPDNAQVVLLLEGDDKFNAWSTQLGKLQAEPNRPIVYVTIKKLWRAHSRIEEMSLTAG